MSNLINTTLGLMEEALLDKNEGSYENDNEKTTWIEYRLKNTLEPIIHRSVHVTLKDPLTTSSYIGE